MTRKQLVYGTIAVIALLAFYFLFLKNYLKRSRNNVYSFMDGWSKTKADYFKQYSINQWTEFWKRDPQTISDAETIGITPEQHAMNVGTDMYNGGKITDTAENMYGWTDAWEKYRVSNKLDENGY